MARNERKEHPMSDKPTILLVDDQHSIRHILSAGLKAHGFEVLTAGSAEKALGLCAGYEGPIDLLLTDISLTPLELGPENVTPDRFLMVSRLLSGALQLRPSVKVVLFTGHSDKHLARLDLKMDAFLLLRKPCCLATLVDSCRQLLNAPLPATGSATVMEPVLQPAPVMDHF
jgi:two-component system OmpR family response regulator